MRNNDRTQKHKGVIELDPTIINALISLGGSLIGTFAGIVATSKLTEYRIKELERKVEKHNSIVERTYRLEDKFELVDEKIKVANHRIDDLEREGKA